MVKRRKVLLVGWDAADWKVIHPLLDRGEMPVLARLIQGGVSGNLASIAPMLSPLLWNSISTGKRPYQHGILGFTEIDPELGHVSLASSASRRCQALWQILNTAGLRTHVVGWFASHPAETLQGVSVSDRYATPAPDPDEPWPLPPGTVSPARLEAALADLRIRPEEVDGALLRLLVPRADEVDQRHDKRLHHLAKSLAETFSVHAATTFLLEHEPWDFAAVYYRATDSISHHFMEFHPPRMRGRSEREFELYRDVVGGAYRLHDAMLGRLLQLAGDEATILVVSDHGFHSDHLRPETLSNLPGAVAEWHRPSGMIVLRGEGLRRDELIHGASLLDITPTVLALYGLPVGRDMDGRVLADAFAKPPVPEVIDTWEPAAGTGRAVLGRRSSSAAEEWSVVRQFFELGYLEDPGNDPHGIIHLTRVENDWNLARAYLDAGRLTEALPLLESIYDAAPERWDYCFMLARCQMNLGLSAEALETATGLQERSATVANRVLLANIEFHRRNYSACLKHLAVAAEGNPLLADVHVRLGRTWALVRRWNAAEQAFRRALDIDADEPWAHLGLASCHLHAKRYEAAAETALHALGLRFDLSLGHFYLGLALARLGDEARAIQAFETCLHYQPDGIAAHRFLATLFTRRPDGAEKADFHRDQVRARSRGHEARDIAEIVLRREVADRARQRTEARAARRAQQRPVEVSGTSSPSTDLLSGLVGPLDFLLVSGLPRSGTSLMMQMLAAVGMDLMADDLRPADADNPRGYFEWETIKKLSGDVRLIEQTHGRVTKVISALLPFLPRAHHFRVIFMVRPVAATLSSQERMRDRRQFLAHTGSRIDVEAELHQHSVRMREMLRQSSNIEVLEIDYPALLKEPLVWSRRVAAFVGLEPECADLMARVVEPDLCHYPIGAAAL